MSLSTTTQIYLAEWPDWGIESEHPPQFLKILESGTRNNSVIFKLNNKRYILRYHSSGNVINPPAYPEFEIQSAVAKQGLAPAILYLDGNWRYQIIEYIEGSHPQPDQLSRSALEFICTSIRTYQCMNAGPSAINNRNYTEDLENYWLACHSEVRNSTEWMRRFERATATIEDYEDRYSNNRGLVHHDLNPLNIILTNGSTDNRCVFIDWEFAGSGIRSFDFGTLVEELGVPANELSTLADMSTTEILHAAKVYREICAFYSAACSKIPE